MPLANPLPSLLSGLFSLDRLALVMVALTLFVAVIVAAYSRRYMRADRAAGRYFAALGLLVGCVIAMVCASNIIVLAIAWVGSGALLARLIAHAGGLADAPGAGRRALLAFGIGDTALIAALAVLARQAGSLDLGRVAAAGASLPPGLAVLCSGLLLAAAAARCALPPFAGWLLSSLTAPTPVSALMHAGLVNAGGFLLIRFAPVLEAAPPTRFAAIGLGLAAALYGLGVMAVRPDVKRALAGSTVSQMGFMVLSCGLGAYGAALWHLCAHGLFKAWLFLGSGSAIGIGRRVPERAPGGVAAAVIAGLALLAAAVAARIAPLTGGFVPLTLGAVTAAASLVGAVAGGGPMASRSALAGLIAGLAGLHTAGLALAHAAAPANAPPLLSPAALLVLLAAFLAVWIWQQGRGGHGPALPPRLYVHLLNAGA